ncbi:MAG: acyl-CoA desaturase [Dehalococcoidia bacterium]|nr:acyl-CoA desaturase [Dehalococcoidia bacterium]
MPTIAMAIIFSNPLLILGVAVLAGFASVQAEMLGHDVGHRQTIRSARRADFAGMLLGNLLLGISYSYWITKHNKHHAFPNHATKDPDGDYPVLALTPQQVFNRPKLLRPLVKYQAFLFLFWLPMQPVFMKVRGALSLRRGHVRHRLLETAALAAHLALYSLLLWQLHSWPLALSFAAVHHAAMGVYNGLVFAPNHKGMALVDDESRTGFLHEQVTTARNIRGNWAVDYAFGALNYQVEHHLFPTMPRNKIIQVRPMVQALCRRHDILYHETSVAGSYRELVTHLHRTSAPLRQGRKTGTTA